ncbi:hypothetical protein DPMN_161439 [Dreissena polymorpha]|uniref:Uncharacterized protein n=1 Tax=Dreissena polymorpha TaxID=45954 RepID=A0A9D4IPN7_DREPO|nr:hypothetical protein DPMN_161439 [Dreissena polymorpha]
MAICDGGGVESRKQENVSEKQQWRYVMVAGLQVTNRITWQKKTTIAIFDGGGVESRIHEYVTEKQQWRYVMMAGLKVAYMST